MRFWIEHVFHAEPPHTSAKHAVIVLPSDRFKRGQQMSYDLYLIPQVAFGPEKFAAYFKPRPPYAANEDGNEVRYWNEETGVYFTFSLIPPLSEAEIREEVQLDPELADDKRWLAEQRSTRVLFNMNYMRPHVFGIEAEPEVASFIKAFKCKISDPQTDGMDQGAFSRDGFLRGWNAGNRFGYQVVLSRNELPVSEDLLAGLLTDFGCFAAPSQDIADVWSWNYRLIQYQATVEAKGHHVFAPRIMWGRELESEELIRFVIWRAGIATILPGEASHVLVGREVKSKRLKARFGFGRRVKAVEETYLLVRRDDLIDVLPKIAHVHANGRDLIYCPAGNAAFDEAFWSGFGSLRSTSEPSTLVELASPDSVLDADIFDALLSRVRTE